MDSIIKGYYNRYRGEFLPPILDGQVKGRLAVGMPLTLRYEPIKGILLQGRPDDYLEQDNSNVFALDNKTSSKDPQVVHPSYQVQLDIYSYLLMKNNYKTKSKAYIVYFFPGESDLHKGMTMSCSVKEICTNPDRVESLLRKAVKVLQGSLPNPGRLCQFCEWTQKLENLSRGG
jgi:hypothetical protein